MKPEECNPAEACGINFNESQKPLKVKTQQGNQDASSLLEPPVGGIPTAPLTVRDFGSTCSDLPVDLNCDERGNQFDSQSNSGQDDFRSTQNGNQKKSSSDLNENSEYNIDGCYNEETGEPHTINGSTDNDIWVPPMAKIADSLATLDDDDEDECVDGVKWGKPSSLSALEEDINQIKEEKEKAMVEVKTGKFRTLVSELLRTVGFVEDECESWVDIISPLAWEAASFVKPDVTEGKTMDPAGCVKIKCVPNGSRGESQLVKGLVFKKHAAHKHMPTKYTKPKVMLVQGMLGHSSGLSSLCLMLPDKDNMSDKDNIPDKDNVPDKDNLPNRDKMPDKDKMPEDVRSLIEQLEVSCPNVVLMEKSAPRDVLEVVLKMGGTLVADMKLHRLERIARCMGSPIWSADSIQSQNLKQCESLYFEKFVEEHAHAGEGGKKPHKTLMFLEGSPTRLGCTILLKGSHSQELKKIKCVVQCAVVMAYHYILETSFLMDQELMFSTIVSDGGTTKGANKSSITSNGFHSEEIVTASLERTSLPLSNGFHEEHPIKSTALSTGQHSSPGIIRLNFDHKKDVSPESTLSFETDTPISGSVLQDSSQVDGLASISHGRDLANGLHEDEPNKLSSRSECKAVIHTVMGTLVSPADQYMKPYLYLSETDSDAQAETSISAVPATVATGHSGAESNGHLNDEKSIYTDNNSQLLSSGTESTLYSQKTGSDSDDYNGRRDDISSVLDSESILVLRSIRNASSGTVCGQSHFSHIKFYRNFDVPLGKFLRDNVLNQSVQCKACGSPPEAHIYYYAHHNKQLTIRVKQIPDTSLLGNSEGKIWMWSRCGKCKPEKEGNKNTTKRVFISDAASGLSFGKFLELSFSNHSSFNRLSNCGHSLHRDFLYFFGLKCEKGSIVSMFKYFPVSKYTVSVPPQKLEFNSPIKQEWLQVETENVYTRAMLFFTEVSGYLKKIETQFSGLTININGSMKKFIDIEKMLAVENYEFGENIKTIRIKNGNSVRKLLCLNRLRWELFLEACIWNQRLQLLFLSSDAAATSKMVEEKPNVDPCSSKESEAMSLDPDVGASQTISDDICQKASENRPDLKVEVDCILSAGQTLTTEENAVILGSIIGDGSSSPGDKNASSLSASPEAKDPTEPHTELLSSNGSSHAESTPTIDHVLTQTRTGVFEQHGESGSNSGRSFLDKRGVQEVSHLLNSRKQSVWNPFSEIREECMKDLRNKAQLPSFLDSLRLNQLHSPDSLPAVSQILSEENKRTQIPLCDDYLISDYEGEISSIIACAMALRYNAENLSKDNNTAAESSDIEITLPRSSDELVSLARATSEPNRLRPSPSMNQDMIHPAPSMSLVESHLTNLLASLVAPLSIHHEVSVGMVEPSLGKPKYTVGCLYASEFRALRDLCCPSELDYIASLSRCRVWDAKGGKSKSFFAKTLDDRLIIKEIRRTELESFSKFAPDYFKYMSQSFDVGNQTCLAKVLGIYQVTIRQLKSGREMKHDLMVMENLSFGRNIGVQYDLKGALHARYTKNADESGDVRLDQNFVIDMNNCPMYVGQKAKRLLQRAVWNDTTFLNRINVMDYSLLVGVDAEGRELVCGIIDYLRQYTWDKQLETWVKAHLNNVQPTIISPKEYKKRFRKFMDTHFLTVPDLWCSRRSANPCKLCGVGHLDNPSMH